MLRDRGGPGQEINWTLAGVHAQSLLPLARVAVVSRARGIFVHGVSSRTFAVVDNVVIVVVDTVIVVIVNVVIVIIVNQNKHDG